MTMDRRRAVPATPQDELSSCLADTAFLLNTAIFATLKLPPAENIHQSMI